MSSTSLLITGADGQLGRALRRLIDADPRYRAVYTDVDTLDLTDPQAVDRYVAETAPDFIVNCAAYTAVDRAEAEEALCARVNTEAVGHIAAAARSHKCRVIHISTDYVFNGENYKPYTESDKPDPCSAYGRTKLRGEGILMSLCPDSIIIRTAWLYSEDGNNFVKTMLRLGAEKQEIGVVADQIGTPTYAGDLASAVMSVISVENPQPGIYHFTDEGAASWYDLAIAVMRRAALPCRVKPLLTRQYPTPARRPHYSLLDKTKIKDTFNITIPHWADSLNLCVDNLLKTLSRTE